MLCNVIPGRSPSALVLFSLKQESISTQVQFVASTVVRIQQTGEKIGKPKCCSGDWLPRLITIILQEPGQAAQQAYGCQTEANQNRDDKSRFLWNVSQPQAIDHDAFTHPPPGNRYRYHRHQCDH